MTAVQPSPSADLGQYAGTWKLDASKATVAFHTKAMWVLPVKGTAKAAGGEGTVTEQGAVSGRLAIDATSISTGMKKRDAHLQTEDFFDTAKYPTIDFVLTDATPTASGQVTLVGLLTVAGQTRPTTITADVAPEADGVSVSATIDDLDRTEWGLTWAKMGAGVHNKVVVKGFFTRT